MPRTETSLISSTRAIALGVLFSCLGGMLHATTSFDFLAASTTARGAGLAGAIGTGRGTLDGLWNNPASLARISNGVDLLFSVENHLGIHALSGGLGIPFPHGAVGFGVTGLSLGTVTGDAQFLGDVGRTLPSGSLALTSDFALSLGSLLGWKIGLDLGGSLSYGVETLDTAKIEGLFTTVGLTLEIPFGPAWGLRGGVALRNLPLHMAGAVAFDSPALTSPALSLHWQAGSAIHGMLAFQADIHSAEDMEYSIGTEWGVGRHLGLRGGYRFGPDGGITFGAGFALDLPGRSQVFLDIGQTLQTGNTGSAGLSGKTIFQVRAFMGAR